jgi:predicted dehydrogenase
MFDTGAHMLNTIVDLAGEGFSEVSAFLDNRGTDVDINGIVLGRTKSGVMVTMHGCGDASTGGTDVRVFCTEGVVRTGVWGGVFDLQRRGESELKPVDVPPALGTWQQFLAVRAGRLANPCPPEVGLRMARLWDAIKESSARGGALIKLD